MNCGKNVRLKPTKIRIAAARAQYSGYSRPVIFGHQIMQPAEIGDHHAADHDVVEMRDDEIGVGDVDVDRRAQARNRPVRPPIVNSPMKPSA